MEQTIASDVAGRAGVGYLLGGCRNMQFYPKADGIKDLSLSRWISHWDVISNDILMGKEIILISLKGDWKITGKVNSRVAYFCIHTAPLIAYDLLPGQTAKARGGV